MRLDWRPSAIAAGAAFVLSLLAGIIGGVGFGALIVRAILGAVVFGAGAAGVSRVVDRFLPDLKQSLANPGNAEPEQAPGSHVDIVVDEESDAETGAPSDFELEEAVEPELESEPDAGSEDFTPGLSAERVHESGVTGDGDGDGDGDIEELEEEPEQLEEVESDRDEAPSEPVDGNLPDIEGFSGSFSDVSSDTGESDESGRSGEDASTMAKAIRTVLKREE